MNLIYASCARNPEYLKQLDMFLHSFNVNGCIDPVTTHLLIITDSELKPLIEAKYQNLKLWVLDCNDHWDSYCLRTKIMLWSEISNYDKILYLDLDILIVNPIAPIFELDIVDNCIYTLEEFNMDEAHAADFLDYSKHDINTTAFTSAILLFRNSSHMIAMWERIINHIRDYKTEHNKLPGCADQPFIVVNFYLHSNFDNKILNEYAINIARGPDTRLITDKQLVEAISKKLIIIHHPTWGHYKLQSLNRTWDVVKNHPFNQKIIHSGHTLVSIERLNNLKTQCQKFSKSNFSFVECGVGKGGCLAVMAHFAGNKNRIYGFDSFEGMPNITAEDLGDYNKTSPIEGFGSVGCNISGGINTVHDLFKKVNLPMSKVKLIKGYFENTLTHDIIGDIGNISILRLDGDWYNSTMVCLERLYDRVVDGGVILIDDYGHFIGAKRATDEFRAKRGIDSPLIQTDYTEHYWIKEIKSTNIHEDIWTCSDEMRRDIAEVFTGKNYKIAEIGAHKGYSTGHLADLFSHVYALDYSDLWTDFSRQLNRFKSNITYIKLDLYRDSWANLPDCDVVFIDADHSYEHCLSDINNSISQFKSLKYIIFDDYGVFEGVKKAIEECVASRRFEIIKFIGLTDVPSLGGIVKDTHEGVIVRLPTAS
jgi:lipopolysaccharide biosynthesis glycosyltransferase